MKKEACEDDKADPHQELNQYVLKHELLMRLMPISAQEKDILLQTFSDPELEKQKEHVHLCRQVLQKIGMSSSLYGHLLRQQTGDGLSLIAALKIAEE